MGTHASAFVEVRDPDNSWRLLARDEYLDELLSEAFELRLAELYSRLGAGALVLRDEVAPLAPPRGWPRDTSPEACDTDEGQDAFNIGSFSGSRCHTWFTLKELLDDEIVMQHRGEWLNKLSLLTGPPEDMRILLCWD